jgi:hypothetical protein
VLVPLPTNTAFAVNVANPVPPLATPTIPVIEPAGTEEVEVKIVPVVAGKVIVFDPAVAGAARVILPLVSPAIITFAILFDLQCF